jgi:hypothetical protein
LATPKGFPLQSLARPRGGQDIKQALKRSGDEKNEKTKKVLYKSPWPIYYRFILKTFAGYRRSLPEQKLFLL